MGLRKDISVSSGWKGWARRALRYGGSLLLGETLQREVELLLQCRGLRELVGGPLLQLLLLCCGSRELIGGLLLQACACCILRSGQTSRKLLAQGSIHGLQPRRIGGGIASRTC